MTSVWIYQPSKTAMQSGKGKTKGWRVEFETNDPLRPEPLMGWIASNDMSEQLHLPFLSLEEAIQFAKAKGLRYTICNPTQVSLIPKSYAANFTCPRIRGM